MISKLCRIKSRVGYGKGKKKQKARAKSNGKNRQRLGRSTATQKSLCLPNPGSKFLTLFNRTFHVSVYSDFSVFFNSKILFSFSILTQQFFTSSLSIGPSIKLRYIDLLFKHLSFVVTVSIFIVRIWQDNSKEILKKAELTEISVKGGSFLFRY